jgi:membrane associated rhomboid family serine protease
MLLLGIVFLRVQPIVDADTKYTDNLHDLVELDDKGEPRLRPEGQLLLHERPLLAISPARGDWNIEKLVYANFIHGSAPHLFLNWVGIFAGARLCSAFLPFLCTLAIFILGGSLGLFASILTSSEMSAFIPHVGASAGIFALMGTYYVYNIKFRTRYFFWFPNRRGNIINLKTSWFFFVDVILMELLLSTAQLLPQRVDSVDHIAHVAGFASGVVLALLLRLIQRWPTFLQTRPEFLFWTRHRTKGSTEVLLEAFATWCALLKINPYNDQVKLRLYRLVAQHPTEITEASLAEALAHITPTYIRLQTDSVADCLEAVLSHGRRLPPEWLIKIPYDSVIRIAKKLTTPAERQAQLLELVSDYRRAHPEGGDVERKLELLMRKLDGLSTAPRAAVSPRAKSPVAKVSSKK